MKQLLLGMVTTLVALTVGTPLDLRMGLGGPQWETSLVSTAVHVSIRRQAPESKNSGKLQ
jgi:hypothetical protein